MGCSASKAQPPANRTLVGQASASPSLPSDLPDSFTQIEGTKFAYILEHGYMIVVKAGYFEECLKLNKPFQDRANIPKEFIYTGEEAVANWKRFGNLFLSIVSYSWLSKRHPDPELFHLKRLVALLYQMEYEFKDAVGNSLPELGFILDFCSLWQRDPDRQQDDEETRTERQVDEFGLALKAINTPYAHRDVTALKLTETPIGEERTYDLRGWTLFESRVIDLKGPGVISSNSGWRVPSDTGHEGEDPGTFNVMVLSKEEDWDFGEWEGLECLRGGRGPPTTPAQFRAQLASRQALADSKGVQLFTSGKDQPFVTEKYENTYNRLAESDAWNLEGLDLGFDYAVGLGQVLPDFRSLKTLNLSRNQIGTEGATEMATALEATPSLTDVDLARNNVGAKGAVALAKALRANTTLKRMSLRANEPGAEGASALAQALEVNSTLARLNLSYADIGDDGAASLGRSLMVNKGLTQISLRASGIGTEKCREFDEANSPRGQTPTAFSKGEAALGKAVEVNRSLTQMDLCNNGIGDDGAAAVAKALEVNTSLLQLNLAANFIRQEGAAALAKALKVNTSLMQMDCSDNDLGDRGVAALARALEVNATLTQLGLNRTRIGERLGEEGSGALAKALKVNRGLARIHLRGNRMSSDGVAAIFKALEANACLVQLDFGDQQISEREEPQESGAREWKSPGEVRELQRARKTALCVARFVALAEALEKNTRLAQLELPSCYFGDEAAAALAKALEANTSLTRLNLQGNQIGNEGVAALAKTLEANASLKKIELGGNPFDQRTPTLAKATAKGIVVLDRTYGQSLRSDLDWLL